MLSPVSAWMGDRLGTLDAVGFSFMPFMVAFPTILGPWEDTYGLSTFKLQSFKELFETFATKH